MSLLLMNYIIEHVLIFTLSICVNKYLWHLHNKVNVTIYGHIWFLLYKWTIIIKQCNIKYVNYCHITFVYFIGFIIEKFLLMYYVL